MPDALRPLVEAPAVPVIHATDYLAHRETLLAAEHITVIGSGQSGAEIFLDLPVMREYQKLHRVTPMYCRQNMIDALLAIYARVRNSADKPNIAIVDYKGLPTQREFEL